MKFYKIILLIFCVWFIAPKFAFAADVSDFKHQTIFKEISKQNTSNFLIDVSDTNLEDDDDVENCTKKHTLHIASILEFYVFGFNIYNLTKTCPTSYYDTVKSEMLSTYILVNNFRI